MQPKTLFLTGAPDSAMIEWESSDLLETFTAPIARFAGLPCPGPEFDSSLTSSDTPKYTPWRSLDLYRQHLHTGHSQVHGQMDEFQGNGAFFTISSLSFASTAYDGTVSQTESGQGSSPESMEEVLSQFYEHSLAVDTAIALSPKTAHASDIQVASTFPQNGESFDSKTTSFDSYTCRLSQSMVAQPRQAIPNGDPIGDLKDLPSASYLSSIQPQTMTMNLIVGIISVSAPRKIKTRRGANVELVELLVGDETKSGFAISFWLPTKPNKNNEIGAEFNMRDILGGLRPQDIVLLKYVAISSFRGRVHGQSLRRDVTKAHLLYRNRIDKIDLGGYYTADDLEPGNDPQIAKTRRVKEWVQRFVGPAAFRKAEKGKIMVVEDLPLDTQ